MLRMLDRHHNVRRLRHCCRRKRGEARDEATSRRVFSHQILGIKTPGTHNLTRWICSPQYRYLNLYTPSTSFVGWKYTELTNVHLSVPGFSACENIASLTTPKRASMHCAHCVLFPPHLPHSKPRAYFPTQVMHCNPG